MEKLRIGIIPELNSMPLFYSILENKARYESIFSFTIAKVHQLNQMMQEGKLDISVCSSLNYAFNKEAYFVLPDISISSIGAVKSIYLFSSVPWEQLERTTVQVTKNSLTTIYLLSSLLFGRNVTYTQEKTTEASALLLTANEAITHFYTNPTKYVYDLGEIWYQKYQLPFVYALCLARKDIAEHKKELLCQLHTILLEAKKTRAVYYENIAKQYGKGVFPYKKDCIAYLENLSYDLSKEHQQGFLSFQKILLEQKVLNQVADFTFFNEKTD